MICPKCFAHMDSISVGEHAAHRCSACEGLWFNLRDHEHIAEHKSEVHALDIGDHVLGEALNLKHDVPCPNCHVNMLRLAVPHQPHIHYESCPVCFGAFFDAGEFTDYASYTLHERLDNFFRGFRRRQHKN
jgi:uncharacterized protein